MKPQSGWIEAFFVVDGALFSAPRLGGAAAPDVMTKGHPAPALSGYFLPWWAGWDTARILFE